MRPRRPDVAGHVADPAEPWLLLPTPDRTGEPVLLEVPWARMSLLRAVPEALGYRSDDVVYTGLALTEAMPSPLALVPPLVERRPLHHQPPLHQEPSVADLYRLWRHHLGQRCRRRRAIYALPSSDEDRAHAVRLVTSSGMPPQIWRAFEKRYGVSVVEWSCQALGNSSAVTRQPRRALTICSQVESAVLSPGPPSQTS